MKFIGLMLVADEDDILAETLAEHEKIVDCFYVLDGSEPSARSRRLLCGSDKCEAYTADADLPRSGYSASVRDGSRGYLHEQAVADHGPDNYFCLLHADEVWTFDPRDVALTHPAADSFIFPLPCYFPHADEPWDDDVPPLEQLRWHIGPGWLDPRMFRGSAGVAYDPEQHFNMLPRGLTNMARVDLPIKHYPYRAPDLQRARAQRHVRTGFDPGNYQHIIDRDEVVWTDEIIARYQQQSCWRELARD